MIYINAREAAFLRKASATSIGAASGRLFRLRKTAMLSRHWRLWLSFPSPRSLPKSGGKWKTCGVCEGGGFSKRSPSLALPPEERLAFELVASSEVVLPERWVVSDRLG